MTTHRIGLRALFIAFGCLLCIGVGSAQATSFQFVESQFAEGFQVDPATWVSEIIIFEEASFLGAGSTGGWDVNFTLNQCLLVAGSNVCEDQLAAGVGPYTSLVELRLDSVPQGREEEEVLLFLSGLSASPDYRVDQVEVVLDPGSSQIPGQWRDFDSIPLQTVIWNSPWETDYYYLGFRMRLGETTYLRYEVEDQLAEGTPVFFTNATYDYIPEPGTGLLLALGLGGLAICGRR